MQVILFTAFHLLYVNTSLAAKAAAGGVDKFLARVPSLLPSFAYSPPILSVKPLVGFVKVLLHDEHQREYGVHHSYTFHYS